MRFNATRIMLAIAAGGVTAGGITFWQATGRQASAEPAGTVLIITKPIKAYEAIKPDAFEIASRPVQYIPAHAIATVGEIVDRRPKWDLVPGDILLEDKLAKQGEVSASPLKIPPGKRAISVAVDEVVGVAGFVEPGTIVDVIAVWAVGTQAPISKVVLQDIRVLAVAQDPKTREDERAAKVSSSVTLAVTPAESERLVLASEHGKIRLAMRSAEETARVTTSGSSPDSLRGEVGAKPVRVVKVERERHHAPPRHATARVARAEARPRSAPAPERLDPVEVIKGNQVEQVNL